MHGCTMDTANPIHRLGPFQFDPRWTPGWHGVRCGHFYVWSILWYRNYYRIIDYSGPPFLEPNRCANSCVQQAVQDFLHCRCCCGCCCCCRCCCSPPCKVQYFTRARCNISPVQGAIFHPDPASLHKSSQVVTTVFVSK